MTLWQMSLSGAVLIAAAVLIRLAAPCLLSRRAVVLMWGLVLLRLLTPLTIPRPAPMAGMILESLPVSKAGEAAQTLVSGLSYGELSGQVTDAVSPWLLLWAAGALFCGVGMAVLYGRELRKLSVAIPVRSAAVDRWMAEHAGREHIAVRQSDQVSTPLTYGIFHPIIIFPQKMDLEDEGTVSYVLLHESIHVHRRDGAFKLIAASALCIHWFNPMVWIMVGLISRDVELACDEAVVRKVGTKHRRDYARTLIRLEEQRSGLGTLSNGFCGSSMEERIRLIMKAKQNTIRSAGMGIVVLLVLAAVFFTSAATERMPVVDRLVESLAWDGSQITFQIPEDIDSGKNLTIHIAGRAEYEDGFSRSFHFLEEEAGHWQPGNTYAVPWDSSYTDLQMDVAYTGADGEIQEESVDLIPYGEAS